MPIDLMVLGNPIDATGTWSGENVTDAGLFAPYGAGSYTITYTVGTAPCIETTTFDIDVYKQIINNDLADQTFCVTDVSLSLIHI